VDGELLKYKARLCVQGFCQIEGIDYEDTFAPTGRLASLRTLLGIAAANNFQVEQMDVRCAFLKGVPKEEIFLKVPDGVDIDVPHGHGLKLQKLLYGLKQSPPCWYPSTSNRPRQTHVCSIIKTKANRASSMYMSTIS
jgi:hypothetical protein